MEAFLMNTNTNTKSARGSDEKIRTMVAVAVFTALAYVCCVVFHFRLSFLSFDLKDAVMAVGAMFFGPVYGFAMVILVAFIEMVTIGTTGFYGFIMNVISSSFFVCVCSLVYKHNRTMKGAVIGMVSSIFSMTAAMMVANILITPYYMGVETEAVIDMIPTVLFPFNLTKAIFNASIAFILYKPMSTALKRSGFIKSSDAADVGSYRPSLPALIIPLIIAVASMLFFFLALEGTFSFVS